MNGRNSHSLMDGVLVLPMLVHIWSLVSHIVGVIQLHHTSKVVILFIPFLRAPELLTIFTPNVFFIPYLEELSKEILVDIEAWLSLEGSLRWDITCQVSANYHLGQCFSKFGYYTSSNGIAWELARNTNSQVPPQTYMNQKLWGVGQHSMFCQALQVIPRPLFQNVFFSHGLLHTWGCVFI